MSKCIYELKSEIKDITEYSKAFKNVLEREYSSLLSTADWRNIDLCIFYLQTGRADSMKECLQLVDRQRQTDEIVGAIHSATANICSTINNGFAALGTSMVACFNALSQQIDAVNNTLIEQHAATMRALGGIERSNAKLISEIELNNALQAKANITSEALLCDYRYMINRY